MGFDYKKNTREGYLDDNVAQVYHDAFAKDSGFRSWRFKMVAARETSTVRRFLERIPHSSVVDIPAGTGKLASMLSDLGSAVVACDISENMLAIARRVYDAIGYHRVEFKICDAARMTEAVPGKVDAIICLRLMHRVPAEVRMAILEQFHASATHVVVSYGIETPYHRARRIIRALIFGGGTDRLSYEDPLSIRAEIETKFEIVDEKSILPFLSQEHIFLIRPR